MKRFDETESADASIAETGASPSSSGAIADRLAAPRYEILGEHGRGGLGRVSRARDRQLGRDVAIKELIARDAVSDARFRREAMITAKLEHPGIVPVHEAGQWADGTPYYAMKLVSGRPLSALIAARATVTERIGLLHHVIAVADAIAYAHGQGVIHRDLKPSNVIVGDFGETVVIDWGLAKELSASADAAADVGAASSDARVGSPNLAARSSAVVAVRRDDAAASTVDALTKAGMVLGTPAYMPPEQARGEVVDQRADVFAIGAMLWELCALTKVPPSDQRQRDRLLRSNGIDGDLIAILDKCLDNAASRRYADGAALAADLKAFKAGARISARQYSLPAMLIHWARRHRRVAAASIAVVIAAVVGVALYARDVAAERRRVEAGAQALILEKARLTIVRDPTSAYELLETYRGDDETAVAVLRAEAKARGVAFWRMHLQNAAAGVIVDSGNIFVSKIDGSIARLLPNGLSYRLDAHRSSNSWFEQSQSRAHGLIVYRCDESVICAYDLRAERQLPAPLSIRSDEFVDVSISPSGEMLGVLSSRELVAYKLFDHGVMQELGRTPIANARAVWAISDRTMWVTTTVGAYVVKLESPILAVSDVSIREILGIHLNARAGELAIATATGSVWIVSTRSERTIDSIAACPQEVLWARSLYRGEEIVYSCGVDIWVWNRPQNTRRIIAASFITLWPSRGDLSVLYWTTPEGVVMAYDAVTGVVRLVVQQIGNRLKLVPPAAGDAYLVTYTVDAVRVWELGEPLVLSQFAVPRTPWSGMLPLPSGEVVVPEPGFLTWVDRLGQQHWKPEPNVPALAARFAASTVSPKVAVIGRDNISVWSLHGARTNSVQIRHTGLVMDVLFGQDDRTLLTLAKDGTLSRWSEDIGSQRVVGRIPSAIVDSRVCYGSDRAIVLDGNNRLWMIEGERLRAFGRAIGSAIALACSAGGDWAASVTDNHDVRILNTRTHQRLIVRAHASTILSVAFSPEAKELAVATSDKVLVRALPEPDQIAATEELEPAATWSEIRILRPQWVAYSPDGRWLAITGDDGAVWFYDRMRNHWNFVPAGTDTILRGLFTSDSERFFAKSTAGKGYIIDMTAPRFAPSN